MRDKPRVSEETRAACGTACASSATSTTAARRASARTAPARSGLAISDITDPYFAQLLIAIQSELHGKGRMVFLCHSTESPKLQDDFVDTLREYNADGLILCPAIGTDLAAMRRVLDWHMPTVMVTRSIPTPTSASSAPTTRGAWRWRPSTFSPSGIAVSRSSAAAPPSRPAASASPAI
jgi:DNA-binding LacI/PurR family transcriptional regulator